MNQEQHNRLTIYYAIGTEEYSLAQSMFSTAYRATQQDFYAHPYTLSYSVHC
jgi:hypothetical protein